MNNLKRIILIAWLIATAVFDTTHAHAENNSLPDSLLTDDYVYEYTFSDFDKAVQIMKELRKRNTYSQFRLDVTEGDLYFNTGRYLQALKYYKRVLESEQVHNDSTEYMEQTHRMISCYDCLHDEAKKAGYVRLLLKKAEECGNVEMKSVALFNMGKMLYYQEDKQRGYEMINEAVSLMKRTDYKYKYDNLRYNYNTLLIMQQRDKRYEDALRTLEELDKVVTEATNAEPGIGNLAEKEKKTMYAQRAVILSRLGRIREADEAYLAWESVGKAYTKDDYLIIPYLMDRKLYDKVIGMYTPREAFLYANKDTINYHMMTVKRSLGKAYEGKKEYKRAARYYEQLAILTDSLKAREQQSSAIELATVYETHEREAELEEQTRQVKIRNVMLLSGGIVFLVLVVLFVRNVQHTRVVRRKNGTMVKTIQELLTYKDELFEAKEKIRALSESQTPNETDDDPAPDDVPATEDNLAETSDRQTADTREEERNRLLFEELDSIVTREKLFLKSDLSRDDLMQLIHVNKNRLGKILQQHQEQNVTSYINNKRLDYAAKLLKEDSNRTVVVIAGLCGLPNIPTFNRLFRTKFGMTPSEYKNGMEVADNKRSINNDELNNALL